MEPRFKFKDFVVVNSDVSFWGNIKGQIIDYEESACMGNMGKIKREYKYLVKVKKSSITKWFDEDDLSLRNSEVTKTILDSRYE